MILTLVVLKTQGELQFEIDTNEPDFPIQKFIPIKYYAFYITVVSDVKQTIKSRLMPQEQVKSEWERVQDNCVT